VTAIERDTDDIYQTFRDDFDASLPPEIARDLCGDAWWEKFREFVRNRETNGAADRPSDRIRQRA